MVNYLPLKCNRGINYHRKQETVHDNMVLHDQL